MPKYSKKTKISQQTKDDSTKIARGTQRPGQTKEQTKLISQGIQKGIDLYKKQQKVKTRELDKKLRQASAPQLSEEQSVDKQQSVKFNNFAWFLLLGSWIIFAVYIFLTK